MNKAKIKIFTASFLLSVMVSVSAFPMAGAVRKKEQVTGETETVITEQVSEETTAEQVENEEKTTEKANDEKETKPVEKKAVYTERDKIIDYALSEVGYVQKNGYNKFSAEFGNGYMAWCNYFVVWCAKQAGVSPKAITGTSSYVGNCAGYRNALRKQGRYFPNDGSYTPKKGDLVFFNYSGDAASVTHIGFALTADENTVTTIEGNVRINGVVGVRKLVRPRYSFSGKVIIIGFGVPAYSGEAIPKVKIKKTADNALQQKSSRNKKLIDVKKFETNSTVEERIELTELIKKSAENPLTVCRNIDFATVVNISYCNNSSECNSKVCMCGKI